MRFSKAAALISGAFGLAVASASGAVATGCGPSFQAVHDGEARFEHCYALDESPSESPSKKAACWDEWSHRYTYGQTRDRVQYAVQRQRALSRATLPTDEAMMGAAPGEGITTGAVAAPLPTSAFAPPPKTLEADAGSGGTPTAAPTVTAIAAPPRSAAAHCADECESGSVDCCTQCRGKKCDDCERAMKACLRKCAK